MAKFADTNQKLNKIKKVEDVSLVDAHELQGNKAISTFSRKVCQEPQPPLLLKKLSQYTSNLYCNALPICIAVLRCPYATRKEKYCQYSSQCIAVRLPFVLQYTSHSYRSSLGKSWWLWSAECSPVSRKASCRATMF